MLVLATPAAIRTITVYSSDQASPAGGLNFVGTFLGSLGVAVLVGLASFAAFFATCFVVCLGGLSLGSVSSRGGGEERVLFVSVSLGLIPGLLVAVWLFRKFWVKKG